MSGGHWDYDQFKMRNVLECVALDVEVKVRFPKLSRELRRLGYTLEMVVHDLDWDLSGDTKIADDGDFEHRAIEVLRNGRGE